MPGHPDNSGPLLSVEDLRVQVGDPPVQAVDGVTFRIGPGEIVGLAGESGSGKSVTALALTRLLPPAARPVVSGSVRLRGEPRDLLRLGAADLRRIRGRRVAYIFQEPSSSFNPVFRVDSHLGEVLAQAGVERRGRRAAMAAALAEVGIEPTLENLRAWPSSYSGGMLQRMAIACAVASRPDLLVADEPTTALDTSTQQRVVELLRQLNERHGMAILFISHNLGLLRQVASRLLVMRQGVVVEEGPAEQVLTAPRHPYTRHLLACTPRLRPPE